MVFNSSSVQAPPPTKSLEPVLNLHLTLGPAPHSLSLFKPSLSQGPGLSTLIPQALPHTHLSSPKPRSLRSLIPSPAFSLSPQAPPSAQAPPHSPPPALRSLATLPKPLRVAPAPPRAIGSRALVAARDAGCGAAPPPPAADARPAAAPPAAAPAPVASAPSPPATAAAAAAPPPWLLGAAPAAPAARAASASGPCAAMSSLQPAAGSLSGWLRRVREGVNRELAPGSAGLGVPRGNPTAGKGP